MGNNDLSKKKCIPCEAGTPAFSADKIKSYLRQLSTSWEVIEDSRLRKEFRFKNFVEAMNFVNKVAEIAEEEQHHPDIYLLQ